MSLLTFISRVSDGLILCESTDDSNITEYREQAKKVLKTINSDSKKALSIETFNQYFFFYIIKNDVCYFSLFEAGFPQRSALKFLQELSTEFELVHSQEMISKAKRPYTFISFDSFVQKTRAAYSQPESNNSLKEIKNELNEVQTIMTKNISEIIDVGERLVSIEQKSDDLIFKSGKYYDDTKALNRNLALKKYAPFAIVFGLIFLFFYLLIF